MLIEQTGCYYTMTPDEHFILDSHPEHPEVIVIAGLSGHGFKFTSVLGEIASKLAMSQRSKFDIDLFRIDRKRMTNVQ
jgi:glycine/D-amino acid oxidase-like deaminating enzyme